MADDNNPLADRVARIAGAAMATSAELPPIVAPPASVHSASAPSPTTHRAGTRPFAAFEWMIALRYLRARRTESFVSVISGFSLAGIALGVGTLIVVMAVMNGFRTELLHRILGLQGQVVVQGVGGKLPDFDTIVQRVRGVDGVKYAAPIVEGQALAEGGGASPGVIVRGIRAGDLGNLDLVAHSLAPGALKAFQGGDSVIIGSGLAERLGLMKGDSITLIAPRGNVTPFGVTPRIKTYTIVGVFTIGMNEYDTIYIFMPLDEAQLYFNMEGSVTDIEVGLSHGEDPRDMQAMVPPIAKVAGPYARVVSWAQRSDALAGALRVEGNVMFLILALIILVAALNIVSGLIMLVKDKSGDIAILRTMGATRGAVMRIFLIAGASIGIVGSVSGLILGTLFCAYIDQIQKFLSWIFGMDLFNSKIYQLDVLPQRIEVGDVAAVLGMALTLTFLATLYPSWRAARLDPVEALRYE